VVACPDFGEVRGEEDGSDDAPAAHSLASTASTNTEISLTVSNRRVLGQEHNVFAIGFRHHERRLKCRPPGNSPDTALCEITPVKSPSLHLAEKRYRLSHRNDSATSTRRQPACPTARFLASLRIRQINKESKPSPSSPPPANSGYSTRHSPAAPAPPCSPAPTPAPRRPASPENPAPNP
jgi:hypothetical protein